MQFLLEKDNSRHQGMSPRPKTKKEEIKAGSVNIEKAEKREGKKEEARKYEKYYLRCFIINTFHFGFPSVSRETSSINDASSLNITSHISRCEWPSAMVAACCKGNNIC